MAYVKITGGTGFASDQYASGQIARLTDSNKTTYWEGQYAHESQAGSYCGIGFSTAVNVTMLELDFQRWGRTVAIGYSNTQPTNAAGFTIFKEIDTVAVPNDDAGLVWGADRLGKRTNRIYIPDGITARYWAVISRGNQPGPMSDGPNANSRLGMYEIAVYNGVDTPPQYTEYTEVVGVPRASSSYVDTGNVNSIIDGDITKGWSSGRSYTSAIADFVGLVFPSPVVIRKLRVYFYTWGPKIYVGMYPNGWPLNKEDFYVLRVIDVIATPNDDDGVPWGRLTWNTIHISPFVPAGTTIALFTDAITGSALSINGGNADRLRLYEIQTFTGREVNSLYTINRLVAEQVLYQELTPPKSNVNNVAQQFLVKDNSPIDLQVSQMGLALIEDYPDPDTATTQLAQTVLSTDADGDSRVTQIAVQLVRKDPVSDYRATQIAEMFLLSELPSRLWLDFGILRNPVKNQLYESQTGTATLVKPNSYIQLEGLLPEGTTLFVNGVATGLSAPLVTGDEVYVYGGVTNYFQSVIILYVYSTVNGEVSREQAGQWTIVQPELVGSIRRSYSENTSVVAINSPVAYTKTDRVAILTKVHDRLVELSSVVTKALTQTADLVGVLARRSHAAYADLVGVLASRKYAEYDSNNGYESSRSHPAYFAGFDSGIHPSSYATLFTQDGFDDTKNHTSFAQADGFEDTTALTSFAQANGFEDTSLNTYFGEIFGYEGGAKIHNAYVPNTYDILPLTVRLYSNNEYIRNFISQYFNVNADFEQSFSHVNMGEQTYEYLDVGKSFYSTVVFEGIPFSRFSTVFYMSVIATNVSDNHETNLGYAPGVGVQTATWQMPSFVDRHTVRLTVMYMPIPTEAYSVLYDSIPEKTGAHELGAFDTYGIMHSVGYSVTPRDVVKTIAAIGVVPLVSINTRASSTLVNLTVYRHEQHQPLVNSASTYMGFDTEAQMRAYTSAEGFYGVVKINAINGVIYNLDVDRTFVCEIYTNDPIAGLIHGG